MPGAARQGMDMAGLGGVIVFPVACSVTINGKPAAQKGSMIVPHSPIGKKPTPHQFPQTIIKASCSVTVEGKGLARAGDIASCFCDIKIGSCDVMVGD